MINLLPPEFKQNITYARRNTSLLRWLAATLVGIGGIGVVIFTGQWYMDRTSDNYETYATVARDQLKAQKLEETQVEVEALSNSMKLLVQVLSRQVLFSEMFQQVGAAMPSGSVLTNLQISNKLEGGLDLQAIATDYQTASQVQVNMQDPNNKLFDKADIVSISCPQNTTNTRYPCTVTVRALFTSDNPFLFINTKQGTAR